MKNHPNCCLVQNIKISDVEDMVRTKEPIEIRIAKVSKSALFIYCEIEFGDYTSQDYPFVIRHNYTPDGSNLRHSALVCPDRFKTLQAAGNEAMKMFNADREKYKE